MINTERNRALLTDLFAALGREGWGEVFLAVCFCRGPQQPCGGLITC
jgi:hypothetical protein